METSTSQRPGMFVTGNIASSDSTPQTGTSSRISRTSTVLTVPDSPPALPTAFLDEKLESLANERETSWSFESEDPVEVPAWWDRSGPILYPSWDRSGHIFEEDLLEDPLALEWQEKFGDKSDVIDDTQSTEWGRDFVDESSWGDFIEENLIEDPLTLEWQQKFWDKSGVIPADDDPQSTEWGRDFIDESPWGDYDVIHWGGKFIEDVSGNPAWDLSGVTDPRLTIFEDPIEVVECDLSGVTDPRYLVAQSWDKLGVYLPSSEDLIEEENMRVNESATLSQQYFDFNRNPPNSHKLAYFLENFPNELEFDWQQYLAQSIEDQDGIPINESEYLETFRQFVEQLKLARRNFGKTSFSLTPFSDESEGEESWYSAEEEQTNYAELFRPRQLSELRESGRRSTDNLYPGRPERTFEFSDGDTRRRTLGDLMWMCPAVHDRRVAQMEEDLPSLGWIVMRQPEHRDPRFHFSIEPCMSGGRSPGISRASSQSLRILPTVDETPISQQSNTEAAQITKPEDQFLQPTTYIPSLRELKERPARRKRFDKFRNKMKFWRSKEKSKVEA